LFRRDAAWSGFRHSLSAWLNCYNICRSFGLSADCTDYLDRFYDDCRSSGLSEWLFSWNRYSQAQSWREVLERGWADRQGGVEARDGIEPPNKGFAGLPLNIWVPRRLCTFCQLLYIAWNGQANLFAGPAAPAVTGAGTNSNGRGKTPAQCRDPFDLPLEANSRENKWGTPWLEGAPLQRALSIRQHQSPTA
jgi:hypothetical protein